MFSESFKGVVTKHFPQTPSHFRPFPNKLQSVHQCCPYDQSCFCNKESTVIAALSK